MGDRALVIFTDKDKTEVSPTVYLHWDGSNVPARIEALKTLMGKRTNDVPYAAGRFVGICHVANTGNLSLGIMQTPDNVRQAIISGEVVDVVLKEYSHGDAGVVVVDCSDFSWKSYGGYLKPEAA